MRKVYDRIIRTSNENNIEILTTIPELREIAVASSTGESLLKSRPVESENLKLMLKEIFSKVAEK